MRFTHKPSFFSFFFYLVKMKVKVLNNKTTTNHQVQLHYQNPVQLEEAELPNPKDIVLNQRIARTLDAPGHLLVEYSFRFLKTFLSIEKTKSKI